MHIHLHKYIIRKLELKLQQVEIKIVTRSREHWNTGPMLFLKKSFSEILGF